jgi:hypothetical protein
MALAPISTIQRAAGEAQQALGHEDHHQDEDDPTGIR